MDKSQYTRKDFSNQNEVRWCPGCGDYAILAALQKTLADLGEPPEKHVFVSGIGCAGRLPYYMNAYGLHTIHGRAPAVATGLKALREDLTVWLITGDGDALSIGGNHFIHCLRRNVNINLLLLNNQVYGLTKGQFSPTSQLGQVTKTSPQGVSTQPSNPISLALAAGASFVARAVDKDPVHLSEVLKAANAHQGTSFVEIYQDCNIFNHGAFDQFSLKEHRSKNTLQLQAGQPMTYGQEQERAFRLEQGKLVHCQATEDNLYQHDPSDFLAAMRLSRLQYPEYPVPLGVYYQEARALYQFKTGTEKTAADLRALYQAKASWTQA